MKTQRIMAAVLASQSERDTEQRDNKMISSVIDQMIKDGEITQAFDQEGNELLQLKPTWPSIQEQQAYWKQRDKDLDKVESTCAWFDHEFENWHNEKDRRLPF